MVASVSGIQNLKVFAPIRTATRGLLCSNERFPSTRNGTSSLAGGVFLLEMSQPSELASKRVTQSCPHGIFWTQAVRLEWAFEQEIPSRLLNTAPDAVCFQLTKEGRQKLERFIDYRKLFDLSAWNHAPADRKPPIVFVGRDQVFELLDPEKYPVNFVAMPNSPDFDQIELAMSKQGRTISRFDTEHFPN